MFPLRSAAPFAVIFAFAVSAIFPIVAADKDFLLQDYPFNMACSGMYAQADVMSGKASSINIQFPANGTRSGHVSVAIFNWKDEPKIGVPDPDDSAYKLYVCDDRTIKMNACNETQRYSFILASGADTAQSYIVEMSPTSGGRNIVYPVEETGYYCTLAITSGVPFYAGIEWINPFGKLPAWQYPKLVFYGVLTFVYLVIGVAWMTQSVRNWSNILPVQNYLAGIIFFLMIEMAVHYGYWQDFNSRGESSVALVIILAIFNAARNAISFFVLLIVSLGYGVVRPNLGNAMLRCKLLSVAHFLCGVLYAAGTMLTRPETAGALVLVFVLPLSLTMTVFYFWILNALTDTVQALERHKQEFKLNMYKRLWGILILSVLLLTGFFMLNSADYAHRFETEWQSKHWHTRWFLLDGWLNLEYLIVFCSIAYLWRPTSMNERYGLQQLAGDEGEVVEYDPDEMERGGGGDGVIPIQEGIRMNEMAPQKGVPSRHDVPSNTFEIGSNASDDSDVEDAEVTIAASEGRLSYDATR